MNLYKFVAVGLIAGLSLSAMTLGCGETPSSPTPAPEVPVVVVPAPTPEPVPEPVVVPEPFCPRRGFDTFAVTEARTGLFQFSYDVIKSPAGEWLKRFQIQVFRNGSEFAMLETQADRLSGPHDRRAIHEWIFPGNDPGQISARIRVHYPDPCRDDGNGNVRANGEWSGIVQSSN
jgi:hypothetical protein